MGPCRVASGCFQGSFPLGYSPRVLKLSKTQREKAAMIVRQGRDNKSCYVKYTQQVLEPFSELVDLQIKVFHGLPMHSPLGQCAPDICLNFS